MKVKEIKIDLFESYIFVFWDCKPMEVHKYITKHLKGLPDHMLEWLKTFNDDPPQGVCLTDSGKSANGLIWLSKSPEKRPDLLAHEISHLAYKIMKHWAIDVEENTNELLAMLTGFITKKTLEK